MIQGYVLVSGTVFIVFNYLVDLSYYLLSPKARRADEEGASLDLWNGAFSGDGDRISRAFCPMDRAL